MRNNNREVVRRLSMRSLRNNKMRNLFAVAAIALTCMLFTALAAMGIGIAEAAQESTMREVGGRFHAGLKGATWEQAEKVTADMRVRDSTWNIFIGVAENFRKRQCEIRLAQGEAELKNSFIELEEGKMPEGEADIIVDTYALDELGLPYELGIEIPLEFSFYGETIRKTFRVCGWYQGNKIGHASELYVSEAYWNEIKGGLTDADFKAWGEAHPEDAGVGLYAVGLYFDSASDIEPTVRAIIRDAGYEPDVTLDYGVNWAYLQNRVERTDPMSIAVLGIALAVILLAGYLIIYNIFYISVFQDIRFYGLLKTVGTTKRQIKRMIRFQALVLSAVGIPVGLGAGYLASVLIFPLVMKMTAYTDLAVKLKFTWEIVVFGIVFALLTVFISCRKPGKIAGSVSPVEAVRYTEGNTGRRKKKKSENGAQIYRMALSNLGRSKKKTVMTLLSLSLSMVLLCVVLTGVGSFRIDAYLEQRLLGDVLLATTNITGNGALRTGDYSLDEEYVQLADAQPGVLSKNELWQNYGHSYLKLDEAGLERYQEYQKQGLLRQDEYGNIVNTGALERQQLFTDYYGYDQPLLSRIKVLEGELDAEKFAQGGYILISDIIGDTQGLSVYRPGDKVTALTVDENSEFVEIKDENGETVDGYWTKLQEKEYEVMAVVDIPISMTDQTFPVNGIQAVLSKQDIQAAHASWCFAISYELAEEHLEDFEQVIHDYGENRNHEMGYVSKASLMEGFDSMIRAIRMIGIALSAVIAFVGILNFINSIVTGIIARRREFAILCSIGMTERQLKKMLLEEGLYYVLISGAISLLFGTILSWAVMTALNHVIMFFAYRPNFLAFLILLPLLAVLSVLVPDAAYKKAQKESIVERLRSTES